MKQHFSLENKVALITGGGTGIGKAIAQCMVRSGARVVLAGRREKVLSDACEEMGDRACYLVHDITQLNTTSEFVETVRQKVGLPDILVNNAGIHLKKSVADTTEEDMQNVLNTHVVGAHSLTKAIVPEFIERGSGSILFITSMAAVFGIPSVCAYSAAKSALLGVVRSYAAELSSCGIRVNAIAPGWIETEMFKQAMHKDPERIYKVLSRTPKNCFGKPEDIGWAAVYLSSDEASFITGQQLIVDGGVSIGF
jgi:gluconate 5-dehydrogenase